MRIAVSASIEDWWTEVGSYLNGMRRREIRTERSIYDAPHRKCVGRLSNKSGKNVRVMAIPNNLTMFTEQKILSIIRICWFSVQRAPVRV